jgi:hypothetical protein
MIPYKDKGSEPAAGKKSGLILQKPTPFYKSKEQAGACSFDLSG